MVDDKDIQPNWYNVDKKQFINKLKSAVLRDCIKECKDTVDEVGKAFGSYLALLVNEHVDTLKQEYSQPAETK
jgi:hypothetical protein